MPYAHYMAIYKLKTTTQLSWIQKHIRQQDTPGDRIIESHCGECTYRQIIRRRIESLPYYQAHSPRADTVMAYSVYSSYSKELDTNSQDWIKACLSWLHKTFDLAPDSTTNILEATFHQGNTPHIHAVVIPIDSRGHLCAKSFTDGRIAMSRLQASYAQAMKMLKTSEGDISHEE